MDVDETMDTPVRVGSGDHRQNGEQNHMRQTIQLAFSPSRVFDFGQQRQKRGELHSNLGSSDSGLPVKESEILRRRNPQSPCPPPLYARVWQFGLTPQVQSVAQPWPPRTPGDDREDEVD